MNRREPRRVSESNDEGAAAARGAHAQPHVLREYALIADGERGGLIGPRGELAWLCVPRWDSAAVFAALIGGGGVYQVCPRDPWFVWGGSYEPGTLIWRDRWTTRDSTIECREALAFPGEPGKVTVLRRVEQLAGEAPVRVHCAPRWDYETARIGVPSRAVTRW